MDACVISSQHARPPPPSVLSLWPPPSPPPGRRCAHAATTRERAAGPQRHKAAGHYAPPARPHLRHARSVAACHAGSRFRVLSPLPCPARPDSRPSQLVDPRPTCSATSPWPLLPSRGHAGRAGPGCVRHATARGGVRRAQSCTLLRFATRSRVRLSEVTPTQPTSPVLVCVEPRRLFLSEFPLSHGLPAPSPVRPLLGRSLRADSLAHVHDGGVRVGVRAGTWCGCTRQPLRAGAPV